MNQPSPIGDSLLTKDYLDLRLARFEQDLMGEFRRQMIRLAVWITGAAMAGSAVSAGLIALAS